MRLFAFIALLSLSALVTSLQAMTNSHSEGKAVAGSLLGGVQQAATSTSPATVPGFVTDSPKEASLDNGSIGGATLEATTVNEAATMIKKLSSTRKGRKGDFDPRTDPMVMNANKATANPEATMDEMIVEVPQRQGETEEIHACIEGGGEYLQTCKKTRVVTIKVTPKKTTYEKHCPGHAKKKRDGFHFKHWTEYCSPGCETKSQTVPRNVEIVSDEWVDGCERLEAQSDEGLCRYEEVVEGGKETKTIVGPVVGEPTTMDSEPITRDCWEKTYTFVCLKSVEDTCQPLRAKGCEKVDSECVEVIGGECVAWKQTLRCPSTKHKTTRYRVVGEKSPFCLTGDCAASDTQANGEMLNVMAHLAVLKEVQNDMRAYDGVEIFKGQLRQCRKNCVGFRDCCTTGKGWGVSLHLAECSGEEHELGDWVAQKRCVFVGTYCAEKYCGKCTRKKSSFCCFGTKLAKVINDQGRRQLGIGFGDAKSPDCRGLKPEELSRIDMSQMNLVELYEDVQKNFKPQTQDHIAQGVELDRIRENMTRMTQKVKIADAEVTTADASPINVPRDEL